MEGKPPSTYAPLSTTSMSSCCEWTPSFAYTCETCVFPFDNGAPTNMTLEATKGLNEGLIQDGYIVVADTIEELAEGLGLPAETLKKTVERQNETYDAGVGPDFGKDAHRLPAIRTAPFYGVRTSGYMLCTLDGITINENSRLSTAMARRLKACTSRASTRVRTMPTRIRICRPATAATAPSPSAA